MITHYAHHPLFEVPHPENRSLRVKRDLVISVVTRHSVASAKIFRHHHHHRQGRSSGLFRFRI